MHPDTDDQFIANPTNGHKKQVGCFKGHLALGLFEFVFESLKDTHSLMVGSI